MNYAQVKALPNGQTCRSNSNLPHQKDGDLRGNLLVNVHTSVHTCGERSNSPRMYTACFGIESKSNAPPFPYITWEGVVGHNIDKCIMIRPMKLDLLFLVIAHMLCLEPHLNDM